MYEAEKIKERYKLRENTAGIYSTLGKNFEYIFHVTDEREYVYAKALIKNNFRDCSRLKFLEVGAGNGSNLLFFKRLGFEWKNMTAVELLDDRAKEIRHNFPAIKLIHGDAGLIDETEKFDVVFQSTVFTSILDAAVKKSLAQKMLRLLSPGGIIIWYDFIYNNPSNKDVKGVSKSEIMELFAGCKEISFQKVTLAPPIGRRIGKLYSIINFFFPFLRSHIVAFIR